jgi:large subunit ribosomal protein L10
MARETRMAAVAEIADKFRSSSGAVLTEYRGLTVKQLTELRRSLGGNASYAVVKNTLTRRPAGRTLRDRVHHRGPGGDCQGAA